MVLIYFINKIKFKNKLEWYRDIQNIKCENIWYH